MKELNSYYLIVGSGRLATHLKHWFSLKNINFKTWSRKQQSKEDFESLAENSKLILLAISDSATADFVTSFPAIPKSRYIHFSGTLIIEGIQNLHPLMSFGPTIYNLENYERIHFASFSKDLQKISQIIPELTNPTFYVAEKQKALYHALCSFTGNLTSLIWAIGSQELEKLGTPAKAITTYQKQIFTNLEALPMELLIQALTGPIARKDQAIIEKQKAALAPIGLEKIYHEFNSAFLQMNLTKEGPNDLNN